jgi:hypothetical protein
LKLEIAKEKYRIKEWFYHTEKAWRVAYNTRHHRR